MGESGLHWSQGWEDFEWDTGLGGRSESPAPSSQSGTEARREQPHYRERPSRNSRISWGLSDWRRGVFHREWEFFAAYCVSGCPGSKVCGSKYSALFPEKGAPIFSVP